MLRLITARQFLTWAAYEELEPFGEERADYRAASIVQTIVNMNRDTKKHPRPFDIEDFVLRFGDSTAPKKKQQTWQEQKQIMQMYSELYKE